MTILLIILSVLALGAVALVLALCRAAALVLALCRAAADTRTVDDGRAFGGDE